MPTYDKYNKINSNNQDFENLRQKIYALINTKGRTSNFSTADKSGFQNYSKKADVSVSIASTQYNIILKALNTNPLNVIYNIVNKGYMKKSGTPVQSQINNILNNGEVKSNDIILDLNDYYDTIDYWLAGTEGSDHRCGGACTGYCTGSCINLGSSSDTGNGCSCSGQCMGSCRGVCVGCTDACYDTCGTGCRGGCNGKCSGCSSTCMGGAVK